MGHPKHSRKKYSRPKKPWDRKRLAEEKGIKAKFGLKNKREIWIAESLLRKKRHSARKLLAKPPEQRLKIEKELVASLKKLGLLNENATLDDVLTLKTGELMERRLETIVFRKGLANTIKQARQFIVHGHIALNGKKLTKPSYILKRGEEEKIAYYGKPMQLVQKKTKESMKKEFEEIDEEAKKIREGKAEEEIKDMPEEPTEAETKEAGEKTEENEPAVSEGELNG